jgi:hypothetical protein
MRELDRLAAEYPRSLWGEDAKQLRTRIVALLAMIGRPARHEALTKEARDDALGMAARLSPSLAVNALHRVLRTEADVAIRQKALRLLAVRFGRSATSAIEEAGRLDVDAGTRALARDALQRIEEASLPFVLRWTSVEAHLDEATGTELPEGRVLSYKLATGGKGGLPDRAVERVVGGITLKEDRVVSIANPLQQLTPPQVEIGHNIASFLIRLVPGSVHYSRGGVAGQVAVGDMLAPFEVTSDSAVILAARRQERLAVVLLCAVQKPAEWPSAKASRTAHEARRAASEAARPVYSSVHRLEDGIVIQSARSAFSLEQANLIDYGLAFAEIPGTGGVWTLRGQILVQRDERFVVGRMATLVGPDGQQLAKGKEIRVPFGNPAGYSVR